MSLPDETRNGPHADDAARLLHEIQKQIRRFWAYARSRPAESWLFFAAGFVLAVLIA